VEEIKIHQFAEKLEVQGYAARTIEDYVARMGQFVDYLREHEGLSSFNEVGARHLQAYQTHVQFSRVNKGRHLSNEGVNARLVVLKTFYRIMHREGLVPRDLSQSIALPRLHRQLPRHVPSEEDMRKLLAAPDTTHPLGLRDRTILEVLYATAIRSHELRRLELEDWDSAANTLFITGKGGKQRLVPVGAWVSPWLREYQERSRPVFVSTPTRLLFPGKTGVKMARAVLARLVRAYAEKAQIKPVTAHSIRHACATHLLHNGADIRYVQELLGHSSLGTTQVYTRVDIAHLKDAHRRFHPREHDDDV
jgi:integrase/recombinase XerD